MSQRRLGYIDQFRGLATVFMIETHVLNALLLTSLRSGVTFKFADFLNGLVAPSFLFVSGFSFTLALGRKGEAYRRFSPELVRHLRRLVFIWAMGYALHIPFFSLRKSLYGATPAGVIAFTSVDILQCIAATLVVLHLIRVLVKSDRLFNLFLYSLFILVIVAAPLAGSVEFWSYLPIGLAQYFNRAHGSLFPLFPWASFLVGGIISSQFMMRHVDPADPGKVERTALKRILSVGLSAVVLGVILSALDKQFVGERHFADYSPFWFILRFGLLLLILYGTAVYEQRRRGEFSVVKLFGRESFFVYVVHLLIVYGSSVKLPSLINLVGPNLGYAGCFGVFLVLTAAMYGVDIAWNSLKRENYDISRQVQSAFVTVLLYFFISRPY